MDKKTPEERNEILGAAVRAAVMRGGFVQSQSNSDAVIVMGKPVNHVLHAILSLVTCICWLPVWGAICLFGGQRRHMITVDEWGTVSQKSLGRG